MDKHQPNLIYLYCYFVKYLFVSDYFGKWDMFSMATHIRGNVMYIVLAYAYGAYITVKRR